MNKKSLLDMKVKMIQEKLKEKNSEMKIKVGIDNQCNVNRNVNTIVKK